MARGINKVILIGTLGRDPETRYMPSGGAVTNLSLATDESYKDRQSGQMVDRTEWHRIVGFNRLAEIMSEYLRKGSKVYIEGKLRTRQWEQDGIKKYTTEIVASEMQMLDSRNMSGGPAGGDSAMPAGDNYGAPSSPPPRSQPANNPPAQKSPATANDGFSGGFDDFDDDIPF